MQVGGYYLDLSDADMESALALVHSRFSQTPSRTGNARIRIAAIAHNGEINTLRGNINWMKARQSLLHRSLFGDDIIPDQTGVNVDGPDSTIFRITCRTSSMGGRSLPHAMMMMIPELRSGHESMERGEARRSTSFIPALWSVDGPSRLSRFTDGTG